MTVASHCNPSPHHSVSLSLSIFSLKTSYGDSLAHLGRSVAAVPFVAAVPRARTVYVM